MDAVTRATRAPTRGERLAMRARIFWFVVEFFACRVVARAMPRARAVFAMRFQRCDVRVSASGAARGGGGTRRRGGASGASGANDDACYVDGSVDARGTASGIGVWYKFGHHLNFAGSCARKSCDNNAVEMCALFAALVRHRRDAPVAVMSDSRYVCKCMEIIARGDVHEVSVNAVIVSTAFVLSLRREKTLIAKVAAHKGGAHTANARADQLALVGSRASEEASMVGFIPQATFESAGLFQNFLRVLKALWRYEVVEELARFYAAREDPFGNGCLDGTGVSEARKKSHRDVYENVKRLENRTKLERPRPFSDDCSVTDVLALDCEMVGVGEGGMESMLAQVCVINEHGNTVYSSYSRAYKTVTDYRTHVSGILPRHVEGSSAREFAEVKRDVAALIKGRIVVGHALENDFLALQLHHPREDTRDTAKWRPLLRPPHFAKPRRLRHLARDFCALAIQCGDAHDPAEDALAALAIYRKFRNNWEGQLASAKAGRRAAL